jgi:hypothetical protein
MKGAGMDGLVQDLKDTAAAAAVSASRRGCLLCVRRTPMAASRPGSSRRPTVIATANPSRHAARTDPVHALRGDG